MKRQQSARFLLILFLLCGYFLPNNATAQNKTASVPWPSDQAISPDSLAKAITDGAAKNVLIINAGPVNNIKGAVRIGAVSEEENQQKLLQYLKDVPKDKSIIIYCGCCPMNHCPNIRPAFQILKDNGFTNFKILDIKENIATDWIRKGYPTEKEE